MSAGDMVIVLDFQTLNRGLRGYQWTLFPPRLDSKDLWDPSAPRDSKGDPQVWVSFDAVGVNSEFEPYGNGLVQIRPLPENCVLGPVSITRNEKDGGVYAYCHAADVDRLVVAMSVPLGYTADEFDPWPNDAKEMQDGRLGILYNLRPKERLRLTWKLRSLDPGEPISSEVARINAGERRGKNLVLFVHGLGGDSITTWGKFPELLRQDALIARRYVVSSFSYPTTIYFPFRRKAPRIQALASSLKTQIDHRYGDYDDITLVCHSLGGVIARAYVLKEIKDKNSLRVGGLVLFAVPNTGSQMANVGNVFFFTNRQLSQLSKDSDFLDHLNEGWRGEEVSKKIRLKFIDGLQDSVVTRESALHYLQVDNEDIATIDRGHRDIVKPASADDDAVIIVRKFFLTKPEGKGKPPVGAAAATGSQTGDRMTLAFDRNTDENYWSIYDANDNRNISIYDAKRRWSTSIFHATPRIGSTYELTIHAIDVTAYNSHTGRWKLLEDRVQIGFSGPAVQRDALDHQRQNPPFTSTAIRPNSTKALKIPKIVLFESSLSDDFTFMSSLWGESPITRYVCVYFVFHVNTRYLFLTSLLPAPSGPPHSPTYFIGLPEISDVNDRKHFEELAAGYLHSIATLPKLERVEIPGKIS
jgi:pimeloyl-ACP methyl ester carboxylesterase